MSTTARHYAKDNFRLTLTAGFSSTAVTLTILEAATSCPTAPFLLMPYGGSEVLNVTAATVVGGGDDTITVERGYDGTSATALLDGASLDCVVNNTYHDEIHERMDQIEKMLNIMQASSTSGPADGVLRVYNDLNVAAQGTPDMTVAVNTGRGFVSGLIVRIDAAENTAAMVAPVTNPRIDIIQISRYSVISIKAGAEAGSPSAPSADANNFKLAEIYHRVGETSIKNTDDSTNGYITVNASKWI